VDPWIEKARLALKTGNAPEHLAAQETPLASDTCVLELTVPEGATVNIDGRDYGTPRPLTFRSLTPGKQYISKLRVRFPEGGEAQRIVFIQGGRVVRTAVMAPSRIVFDCKMYGEDRDSHGHLYSVSPSGRDLRRLTRTGKLQENATLSPDGAKILVECYDQGSDRRTRRNPYVLNVDGTGLIRVLDTEELGGTITETIVWSPDNSKIAFEMRIRASEESHIYISSVDGTDTQRLTAGGTPAWSPDGSKIAFVREEEDGELPGIYVMESDGTHIRRLARGIYPVWSPDGSKIAFARLNSSAEGEWICVMNADGTAVRQLCAGSGSDDVVTAPCAVWSPEGSKIAFIPDRDVRVVTIDDGNVRRLTRVKSMDEKAKVSFLCWSPDGSRIAFLLESLEDADFGGLRYNYVHIYLVNRDGTGLRPVLRHKAIIQHLDWR
jgi:Tol biopolymer transport system component